MPVDIERHRKDAKEYYHKNKDKINEQKKKYRKRPEIKEKIRKYMREYMKTHKKS